MIGFNRKSDWEERSSESQIQRYSERKKNLFALEKIELNGCFKCKPIFRCHRSPFWILIAV